MQDVAILLVRHWHSSKILSLPGYLFQSDVAELSDYRHAYVDAYMHQMLVAFFLFKPSQLGSLSQCHHFAISASRAYARFALSVEFELQSELDVQSSVIGRDVLG